MPNAKGHPLPRTGQLWTKRPPAYNSRDMYWVYEFIRRLSTPFVQWAAYKNKLIDKKGNVLVQVSSLTPADQAKKQWTHLDQLSAGIKQQIDKVPGIQPKLKTIVGTMMLMKERAEPTNPTEAQLNEEVLRILNTLTENEAPVNAISAGNIQSFSPLLTRRKKLLRRIQQGMKK